MPPPAFRQRRPSFWEQLQWGRPYDLVVIGGGLVGLQTALAATDISTSLKVAVVERAFPPAGASTRNAGFACVGSLGELIDDIDQIGYDATLALVKRRHDGLKLLRARIPDHKMRFQSAGNVEWFRAGDEQLFEQACELLPAVNKQLRKLLDIAFDVFVVQPDFTADTGLAACGAILNRLEGELQPAAVIDHLQRLAASRGVRLLPTCVSSIEGGQQDGFSLDCEDDYSLHTKQLVVATNAFTSALQMPGSDLRDISIRPALNQVIVSSPIANLGWHLPMHLQKGYGYIRRFENRVLVGGFRTLVGDDAHTDQFGLHPALSQHLRQVLTEVLPTSLTSAVNFEPPGIDYEWSGVLGLGPNRQPHVTTTSNGAIIAAGLGGMGIALGSALAHDAVALLHSRF